MELHQIIKYFGGDCSEIEREEVELWVKSSEENKLQFQRLKRVWDTSITVPDSIHPNFEKAWKNIIAQTGITDREAKLVPLRTPVRYLLRIAAVIVILIGIGTLAYTYFHKQSNKIEYTQDVGKKEVQLADGTIITLNRNSSISFPEKFKSGNREVILKGEAFFKVAKDPKHPFIVHANGSSIKVLGTSFNIKIKGDELVQVSVLTGKVAFQSEYNATQMVNLVKGEQGTFRKASQQLGKQEYNNENFLAWETGIISFNNTPLSEAAKVLEGYYNTPIQLHPDLLNRRITVTFNNLPLTETLEILKMTLNVQTENFSGKIVLTPIRKN
jgi:transmembrane sensor